jgi:SAM-dependent methyltransferase
MRNQPLNQETTHCQSEKKSDGSVQEIPYEEKTFFESFYSASIRGTAQDRMTIGAISEFEARFHYNAVENSIIRAVMRREPPPKVTQLLEAWRVARQRRGPSLLDVGSGTGHWVDFFRDVFHVRRVVAVEITEVMAGFLRTKYAAESDVSVIMADLTESNLFETVGEDRFDYVTAIGVMFHIVDDQRWMRALQNLAGLLKPNGLMFVGGDFGAETRNVQFHKTDSFHSWSEHDRYQADPIEVRVNKRVRSLVDWDTAARNCGLVIADLVRSDSDAMMNTPENDVLVLMRALQSND